MIYEGSPLHERYALPVSYHNGTVSVSTTATAITETYNQNQGVLLQNRGPVPVWVGGSTVTADNTSTGGYLLSPGDSVTVSVVANIDGEVYGVTLADTAYVAWLEVTI